jgi:hypothetical protein
MHSIPLWVAAELALHIVSCALFCVAAVLTCRSWRRDHSVAMGLLAVASIASALSTGIPALLSLLAWWSVRLPRWSVSPILATGWLSRAGLLLWPAAVIFLVREQRANDN